MTEKYIEEQLRLRVRAAGGLAYKFTSPGNAGVPDRIVILPNKAPIFVELKSEVGRISTLQSNQIWRLRKLGQTVEAVYGMDGLDKFCKKYGIGG